MLLFDEWECALCKETLAWEKRLAQKKKYCSCYLIQKRHRLDSGNFKALAATDVFTHDHIVAANHIGLRLGELGAIALVGAAGELLLLGPHQPCKFVFTSLTAVGTRERVCLLGFFFVEKIAFVHHHYINHRGHREHREMRGEVNCLRARGTGPPSCLEMWNCWPLWFNSYRAKKEEAQKVQRHQRGKGGVAGSAGDAQAGEARRKQEASQKRQAQTQPRKAAGGC